MCLSGPKKSKYWVKALPCLKLKATIKAGSTDQTLQSLRRSLYWFLHDQCWHFGFMTFSTYFQFLSWAKGNFMISMKLLLQRNFPNPYIAVYVDLGLGRVTSNKLSSGLWNFIDLPWLRRGPNTSIVITQTWRKRRVPTWQRTCPWS